jgi:UDP-N-acetylmuramoylalanine--D-glutamate ligase
MHFDLPVLLYGAGKEAISTRAFLAARAPELKVYVTADSGSTDLIDGEAIAPEDLEAAIAGRHFATIVKSPGVSLYRPIFATARGAGIAVTSNINLWGDSFRAGRRVVAITGTKGKSTTATLAHLMLTRSGVDAGLAGNVGLAPLDIASRHRTVVFELSSYQTADLAFAPDIAGVTNLYPEHVDWHGSVERYYADKLNLIDREGEFSVALGAAAQGNEVVRRALRNPARMLADLGAPDDDAIVAAVTTSRLKGAHNLDNARLAARLALAAGASLEGILSGIADFVPLPHRLEEHVFGGTIFVNDSISTTPEATKAALAAYKGYRIALIAGGHDRQQDYADLAGRLAAHGVTTLICLPVTGARLAEAARSVAPHIEVLAAGTLTEAVEALARRRQTFDAAILSPGAPSYGQLERPGVVFRNFEERGRAFVNLARDLFEDRP